MTFRSSLHAFSARAQARFAAWFLPEAPSRPTGPSKPTRSALSEQTAALLAPVLLSAAVLFNAALALINAQGLTVSNSVTVLVQGTIIGSCAAVSLLLGPSGSLRWLVLGWALAMLWLGLCFSRGQLELKVLSDMLQAPIFVALGLGARTRRTMRVLVIVQVLLVIGAAWELFAPTSFGNFFSVQQYYINSRGLSQSAFWAGENNLFISSQRPEGRLLTLGLDVARASSLFLEPVSLGNWTVLVWAALIAFSRHISRREFVLILVTNLLLLYACDGRFAIGMAVFLPVSMLIFRVFPLSIQRWLPSTYLPAMFIVLALAVALGALQLADRLADTLHGRLARGIYWILSLDLREAMGSVPGGSSMAADSGWMNIILGQSIFGLAAMWLALTVMPGRGPITVRLVHCLAAYMAFAFPISNSMLSIKTAALMWYLIGLAIAEDARNHRARAPARMQAGAMPDRATRLGARPRGVGVAALR